MDSIVNGGIERVLEILSLEYFRILIERFLLKERLIEKVKETERD